MNSKYLKYMIIICIFILLHTSLAYSDGIWKHYTNTNNIIAIDIQNETIWCHTSGGFVRWNRLDGTYKKFTEYNNYPNIVLYGTNTIWTAPHDCILSDVDILVWKNNLEEEINDGISVGSLAVDHKGVIWAGTFKGDVVSFDETGWTLYTHEDGLVSSDRIYVCAVDNNDVKWFGTMNGVSSFDGENWSTYTTEDGLVDNKVTSIAVDRDNVKWFGTEIGISSFDGALWKNYNRKNFEGLLSNNIKGIAVDNDTMKWFATSNGLTRFDGSTWTTFTADNSEIPNNYINAIDIDDDGMVWLSTGKISYDSIGNGLTRFDGYTWKNYTTTDGPLCNIVKDIVVDDNNVKWFYTDRGVSCLENMKWTHFSTESDSVWREVKPRVGESKYYKGTCTITDLNGVQWTGDFNGVISFDGSLLQEYTTDDGLVSNTIWSLAVDRENVLWVGTDSGVSCFDGTAWRTYNDNNGFVSDTVYVIAVDNDNKKWYGTHSSGLWSFNGSTWATFTVENSNLAYNRVRDISVDHNNVLWIIAIGLPTLQSFDGSVWKTYDGIDEFGAGMVESIAVDQDNVKWFASSFAGGVLSFDDDGHNDTSSHVSSSSIIPSMIKNLSNYPNPFNPYTSIRYQVPIDCYVELIIYDIIGRRVSVLHDGKVSAGVHEVVWNGKNENGTAVGSGVYLYSLKADKYVKQGKMLLMK